MTDCIVPKIKCRRSGNVLASCPPCINKISLMKTSGPATFYFFSFFLEVHQQLKTYRHRHPVEHVAKKEKVVKLLLHDVSVLYKPDCDGVFACHSLLPLTHDRRAVMLQEGGRSHFASVGKADLCF